ncbi:hypothetical protein D9M71_156830 [compost metagenome]
MAQLDVPFDVLHHHDGVVHHDADGQHQAEQAQGIDGKAEQVQAGHGADDGHRHRQQRDDRGPPGLQEEEHHDHHQGDGLEQRLHHGVDARLHGAGGVVDDTVIQPGRELGLQLLHGGLDAGGDVQGVGSRRLHDRQGHGRLLAQIGAHTILLGRQFDARHVAQQRGASIMLGAQDDVAELLNAAQTAVSGDRHLERGALDHGCHSDAAHGSLGVLLADRRHHLGSGEATRGHRFRIKPDAHGIGARSPEIDLTHAVYTGEPVADVTNRIVAQVVGVVLAVWRNQMYRQGDVRRTLDRGHPQALHVLRQTRGRLFDAVTHPLQGLVRIGPQLEGHRQEEVAVGIRQRLHVEHVLDAVDLFLDRCGHGLCQGRGIGARVLGMHDDGRRHDLRVFGDGQAEHCDGPGDEDQRRDHAGEDRPVDEKAGQVHRYSLLLAGQGRCGLHHPDKIAGPDMLGALDDHPFAWRKTLEHDPLVALPAAKLQASVLDPIVFADQQHEAAVLIGRDHRLVHQRGLVRIADLYSNPGLQTGYQATVRVRQQRADAQGAGTGIQLVVQGIQLAGMGIAVLACQAYLYLQWVRTATCADVAQVGPLIDGEGGIQGIEVDDGGQGRRIAASLHLVAGRDFRTGNAPGDWRGDAGVVDVQAATLGYGPGGLHRRACFPGGIFQRVEVAFGDGVCLDQALASFQLPGGESLARPGLGQHRLGAFELRFEGRRIERKQQVTLAHQLPVAEVHGQQGACNPWTDLDVLDCLQAPGVLGPFADLPAGGGANLNAHGFCRFGL